MALEAMVSAESAVPASAPARLFERLDGAIAVAFALLFAAFVAVSWAKWPLVTADSARELYVPFQLLHGQVLYRDFYYLYGPVAPVLNAGLLKLFGARLEVLYVASLLNLAAVMALLYTLARHLLRPWPAAAVLFVFFTHFALGRDIWGYVWPYAFAATYAVTLGLALLVALARFAETGHRRWLVMGSVALGLSVVTKIEYGFAAAVLAAAFLAGRALFRPRLERAVPGWRGWLGEALALGVPAVAIAGAIVAAVLAHASVATVLESVWPVALMKLWNSAGAWHGTAASWVGNLKWVAIETGVLGAIVGLPALWARKRALAVAAALGLVAFAFVGRHALAFYAQEGHIYWMGPGFLLLFGILGWVGWRLVRDRARLPNTVVLWGLVALYGCMAASRTLMTGYNDYTRYQAPVWLIAWVALAAVWLPHLVRAWLPHRRPVSIGLTALVLLLGGRHLVGHVRDYMGPHVPVAGAVGTVLTQPEFGVPYNQALAYLKQHLRPGDSLVAATAEASLYTFTGVDNPLMEDQLFYGYLTTSESQQAAIRRMQERQVRYFVLSNYGFGQMRFGETFMQDLSAWLKTRCRVAGVYGTDRYRLTIYETPFGRNPQLAR